MAHHMRKRPKNRRAGCLLWNPWKMNGFAKGRVDAESLSDHRRRFVAERQLKEARVECSYRHSVVNFKYNIPPKQRRIQQLVAQFNADEELWFSLKSKRRARRKLHPRMSAELKKTAR